MSKIIVLLAAALALIGSFRVNAAEVTYVLENGVDGYEGVDDTSIFSESTNSGGGSTGIFSGTNAQLNLRRALIRFDLTPIPANATILDVTLSLTVDRSGGNNSNNPFGLHRVQQAWGEGDVVGASQGGFGGSPNDGDATWTSSSHGNTLWTAPGGDFITGASASATSGQADSVTEWDSATMAAAVQAWLAAPDTNFGCLLLRSQE